MALLLGFLSSVSHAVIVAPPPQMTPYQIQQFANLSIWAEHASEKAREGATSYINSTAFRSALSAHCGAASKQIASDATLAHNESRRTLLVNELLAVPQLSNAMLLTRFSNALRRR